ncbi:MAG: chorismate mutase [Oscillospiraceae bacterium]|nr:chorismate mutase [Oscillospiraceae bacterium]
MSEKLSNIRTRIDEIDRDLLALFAERMHLSDDIAEIKRENNISLVDPKREEAILQRVFETASPDLRGEAVTLMRSFMAMSKSRQRAKLYGTPDELHFPGPTSPSTKDVTVAYQGVPGSWSEVAARKLFSGVTPTPQEDYEDVFVAVKDLKATYGVVPIENSAFGGVGEVYDLLRKYGCYIVGQTWVPTEYALAALPGTKIEDIRTVFASDKAFKFCKSFLRGRHWQYTTCRNFAESAARVHQSPVGETAAIVSTRAAQVAGLSILSPNISPNSDDRTRYIVIAASPEYDESCDTVSITFLTSHRSGALVDALFPLMSEDISLKRLESRPMSDGRYYFFCDLEGNIGRESVANALQNAAARCSYMEILGCYLDDTPIRQVH